MEWKPIQLVSYSVSSWTTYILLIVLLSLCIKVFLALLRAIELSSKQRPHRYWLSFWQSLRGYDQDPYKADYWFPFLLGIMELFVYPFFVRAGLWIGIGVWIGLKTLPQWKSWTENRPVFNRYLIGNALVVILSVAVLANYVDIRINTP